MFAHVDRRADGNGVVPVGDRVPGLLDVRRVRAVAVCPHHVRDVLGDLGCLTLGVPRLCRPVSADQRKRTTAGSPAVVRFLPVMDQGISGMLFSFVVLAKLQMAWSSLV